MGHAIFGRGIPGGGDYYPGHLKPKPDAKYWIVHTEREVEGRHCLVLRVNAKAGAFDIWVDTTRESAVIRFVELIQGLRRADLHIDYQETPKGWLPKQWKWSRFYYHVDGRLESMEEMFVDKLTLEPPLVEADFTFEEKQGMLILENVQAPPAVPHGPTRITERQWFRIDASGKRTEVPKDKAPESGSPFWWGMALALPAVAFALLLYTRFRKGKPPG